MDRLRHSFGALALGLACGAATACKKAAPDEASGSAAAVAPPTVVAQLDTSCLAGATHKQGALTWFEDAFEDAARCATAVNRPLIVDFWAPWCHTCVSMREFVLSDPSLADVADQFVFLALDTDRPQNAAAVAAFPPAAWPTFVAISDGNAVQARHVGSANLEQFRRFLAEGARAHAARHAAPPATADANVLLVGAERAATRNDLSAAASGFAAALAAGGPTWARRPEVLVNLVQAQYKAKDLRACLALAEAEATSLPLTSSRGDFLAYAVTCAADATTPQAPAPAAVPGPVAAPIAGSNVTATSAPGAPAAPVNGELIAAAKRVRELAVRLLTELADAANAPISVDDRSDVLMNLRTALDGLDRHDDALSAARRQRDMLDVAAAKAATPAAASTFNWPRAEVYVYLGDPLALVAALEQSAADLPTNYDPPHRVAWLYYKAGRLTDAKAWGDKALALAYGARRDRVAKLLADIAATPAAAP